ncbi:MAG TPA: hypothetical protein VFQ80_16390 [Thermomicrobiales bacterium]|nr:hypothetical protein [Thermomicrobiales bacterium]
MDPNRFDALVLSLARRGSRRRLLAAAVAGAVAPLTAAANHRHGGKPKCLAAGKRCKPTTGGAVQPSATAHDTTKLHRPGKGKGKGNDRSNGSGKRAVNRGRGTRHAAQGARKGKGSHRTPSCAKCCSGLSGAGADGKSTCACVADGDACQTAAQCCGGVCRSGICTGCPSPQVTCGGLCVDLQTDDNHCGSCGHACGSDQRCQDGSCICDATNCPNGCCDGATATCKRGTSDSDCGDGGTLCQICNACQTCNGTTCAAKAGACCGEGKGACQDGQCVACAAGQRCQAGACVCDATSCSTGCCDGATCHAGTDNLACGTNGDACVACVPPATCGGGGQDQTCGCTPATSCPAGQTCGTAPDGCGGTLDCGACDENKCLICGAGNTCVAAGDNSGCGSPGSICCSGACINSNFDNSNCGKCGQTCSGPLGVTCVGGVCCQSFTGTSALCSNSVPCCAPFRCENGFCCGGRDQQCDDPSDCCSGDCDTTIGLCN